MRAKEETISQISYLPMDQAAFDSAYQFYSRPVYANIFKIVRQQEFAEDILQEVFITLWEKRDSLDATKSIGGWLFVVSYNKSLSFLRKKVKEAVLYVEDYELYDLVLADQLDADDIYHEQIAMIEEAAEQLSPRIKEVFTLSRFEGNSVDEVAEKLGLSSSSVKDYLKQSNKIMKTYINNKYSSSPAMMIIIAYMAS